MSDTALAQISDPAFKLLCEQVVAKMAQFDVPGVAVGVINGEQQFTAGFGVTSIENPLPVNSSTLFQIGSITKTITAVIALRLVEQGKLDLDTPVRAYAPDLRLMDDDVAQHITMRHLLTHTSGFVGDYFDDFGNGDDALERIVANLHTLPQLTPIGAVWHYSNAGFYLAGRVIELVAGKPYETVAKELVLDPLGMKLSFFFPGDLITYRVAIGHENPFVNDEHKPVIARPYALPRTANPVGGLVCSVEDQLRYARFLLGDGTAESGARLLTPESMALLLTPQAPAADGQWVGVTIRIRDLNGVKLIGHTGSTNGQQALLQIAPEKGFAISVLTNADGGGSLCRDVLVWALKHYLGYEDTEPTPLDFTAQQVNTYGGLYTYVWSDIEIFAQDDSLWTRFIRKTVLPGAEMSPPEPPVKTVVVAPDHLLIVDEKYRNSRIEMLRDEDGAIKWLRYGGRIYAHSASENAA